MHQLRHKDPTGKHARHAAKVLIKYHLMEEQRQPWAETLTWAVATPLLASCQARAGLAGTAQDFARGLIDELVSGGALHVGRWRPEEADAVEPVLLVALNAGGLFWSRHLIHDPAGMVIKNFAFLVLAWVGASIMPILAGDTLVSLPWVARVRSQTNGSPFV